MKLGERPSSIGGAQESLKGLEVQNLTDQIRQMYHIPSDVTGVFVANVKENSAADKAGIKPGDVIIQVEDMDIKSVEDLKRAFEKYKGPKRVFINRRGLPMIKILE